jgi:hypothetical protein
MIHTKTHVCRSSCTPLFKVLASLFYHLRLLQTSMFSDSRMRTRDLIKRIKTHSQDIFSRSIMALSPGCLTNNHLSRSPRWKLNTCRYWMLHEKLSPVRISSTISAFSSTHLFFIWENQATLSIQLDYPQPCTISTLEAHRDLISLYLSNHYIPTDEQITVVVRHGFRGRYKLRQIHHLVQ